MVSIGGGPKSHCGNAFQAREKNRFCGARMQGRHHGQQPNHIDLRQNG